MSTATLSRTHNPGILYGLRTVLKKGANGRVYTMLDLARGMGAHRSTICRYLALDGPGESPFLDDLDDFEARAAAFLRSIGMPAEQEFASNAISVTDAMLQGLEPLTIPLPPDDPSIASVTRDLNRGAITWRLVREDPRSPLVAVWRSPAVRLRAWDL